MKYLYFFKFLWHQPKCRFFTAYTLFKITALRQRNRRSSYHTSTHIFRDSKTSFPAFLRQNFSLQRFKKTADFIYIAYIIYIQHPAQPNSAASLQTNFTSPESSNFFEMQFRKPAKARSNWSIGDAFSPSKKAKYGRKAEDQNRNRNAQGSQRPSPPPFLFKSGMQAFQFYCTF